MSYQVLARKYRPKNFETLVGQEHVVRALTHALQSGRLHHAYLFTGTRGVGKTTLSRILAKSLNCIGPDGAGAVTAQPCGVCHACSAIDAGRFVDYIEMDAASNRGVDEMAQLLEQAVYAPSNARFKVYMIDEVHMLTNHAFNSMLKTLEEPPDHVKFILATTDPQKIPVTVLSRCLQFNLKQMPPGHIISHLDDILGQEGIAFEPAALRLLAQGAHGSMRDALSLTDQAIAYAAGEVSLEAVQGMLGALDQTYLIRLLDALAGQDGADLLAVADEMASRSLSYNGALQDLGTLLHSIALAQTVPSAVPPDLPELADILRLATAFDAEEVQLYYQIAVHGRNELGLAPDEYAGFTMTLLRMLAFRPGNGGADRIAPAQPPTRTVARAPAAAPRAASSAIASHALLTPALAVVAAPGATFAAASPAASVAASAPAAPPAAQLASQPASQPAAQPASQPASQPLTGRAAALEAARVGSKSQGRHGEPRPQLRPRPEPAVGLAPAPASLSRGAPKAPPPWEENAAQAPVRPGLAPPTRANLEAAPDEALPPWVTEFSDESATLPAPAAPAVPGAAQAPAAPTAPSAPAARVLAIPGLAWDGNWPALAAALPLRGVAQQLALQTELIECQHADHATNFSLRVPIDTLRASGNTDKLSLALSQHFGRRVTVEIDLGPVRHTAGAHAQTEREARQREAEHTIENDPFVRSVMRDLGAIVVPGSIRPTAVAP